MPSDDNWQGDVLRDLRSGPPTTPPNQPDPPQPHQDPTAPHPAQPHHGPGTPHAPQPQPGPGTPHPAHAPQGPGPSYPSAAAPQGYPGHAAPHQGQAPAPGTPAYGYPNQTPAPQAPAQAAPQQGQDPAYDYPGPGQAQAQPPAHAAGPRQGHDQEAAPQGYPGHAVPQQAQAPGTPAYGYPNQAPAPQAPAQAATPQGQDPAYGYPGPGQAQAPAQAQPPAHAADPRHFPHQAATRHDPAQAAAPQGQAPGYGYPAPNQPPAQNHAADPQAFPHRPATRQGPHQAAAPQGQAPAYGYPGPGGQAQTPSHASHAAAPQGPAHPNQPQGQGPGPHQPQAPGHAAAPQGRRTPDSRPSLDRKVASAGRKPLHGEPFAARATRALRRIVSSSAAREVAEATRAAELLQQPVTTGRQIAVTSIRGGAGKSTVAALLGTTYAHYRQDPVLFVEADPALGSLPIRLGAESLRWTTGDIADIVEPQMSLLDITGYLVQLRDNAWLLPGSQGQIGAMLDTRSYERAMVALRRYFGVTVVDCETLPAEVARVALTASQARVLTTPATLDGVMSTYAVLQWMRGLPPHVIAGTVVVLTEQSPHSGIGLAEAVRSLESIGTSVHVLPYDRHLAAGGRIRTELLAHSTRQTAAGLAADVFQLSQQRH
ncbi:cobalamin biosynthesis protein CbiA [Streptomyces sp. NPDC001717]|uniref:cobalamin biosynthesis protein CbiA n=1 Tax=Streptomyces sp. NPDC001717 TaxID=3364604 RepID=UPI0036C7F1E3